MKTAATLTALFATLAARFPCESYCVQDFVETSFCLSTGELFPNLAVASCHRPETPVEFECPLMGPVTLDYCTHRCHHVASAKLAAVFLHNKCHCPRVYRPICARNGLTYFNDCLRQCNGADFVREGPCSALTAEKQSSLHFQPVCGHNGLSYANAGVAANSGSSVATPGTCAL